MTSWALSGRFSLLTPSATTLQRVDVQAGIGFVEDGELGFEHGHLEDLVALLFAAGEAFVDRALEQVVRQVEQLHLLLDQREELHGVELGQALVLADFVERGLEEVGAVHARNLDRILEGEEHAFAGALLGVEVEQVLAAVDALRRR